MASLFNNPSLGVSASGGSILDNKPSVPSGQHTEDKAEAACEYEHEHTAWVASTSVMSKASRANLRRNRRRAALRVIGSQPAGKASSSPEAASFASRTETVAKSGNEIAVQCNLGEAEWHSRYDKLRQRYDKVKLLLAARRGELPAVERMAGLEDSDEEVPEDLGTLW